MRGSIGSKLEAIRASFWFIPAVMAAGALLLSIVTVAVDQRGISDWLGQAGFIYLNQPSGARSLLSTIAGSIMNVAGVIFSLTIVALTLASQQFGPRLLGNFMRDRGNQTVLGIFVATFLYCLLILRTIRSEGDGNAAFVPHLSITIALLVAIVALGATIYFIHHIASSIQVENVISRVSRDLDRLIGTKARDRIFPGEIGLELDAMPLPADFDANCKTVRANRADYFHGVDGEGLIRLAAKHDCIVRLHLRPGSFVLSGQALLDVYPATVVDEAVSELRERLVFDHGRTQTGEPEALFDQLLELALRSLSASNSDPRTANACLDRVSDALLQLSRGPLPGPARGDRDGRLRVVADQLDLPALATRLFSALRSSLAESLVGAIHASRLLERCRRETSDPRLARAFAEAQQELLSTCRERMDERDYRSLVSATEMSDPRSAGEADRG